MNFSFFMVGSKYCDFLRKIDPRVPYMMDKKSARPLSCLKKVEMNILITDTKEEVNYKNLLSNQLSWCNSHKKMILKQAEKLYFLITQERAWENLAKRCCKFSLDEKRCEIYENA